MGQPTAKKIGKKTNSATTAPAQDEIGQYMETINAKQLFFGSAIGMGWRLAVAVLVPIVAGVKLDDHFQTEPSYTLAGLMIAAFASVVIITKTVQEVNRQQAENFNNKASTKPSAKGAKTPKKDKRTK